MPGRKVLQPSVSRRLSGQPHGSPVLIELAVQPEMRVGSSVGLGRADPRRERFAITTSEPSSSVRDFTCPSAAVAVIVRLSV